MADVPANGLQLRSNVSAEGMLEVSLTEVPVGEPGPDEVVVRVEATPINPSDLGLLVGPADLATATVSKSGGLPTLAAKMPPAFMKAMAPRVGQPLPVGNEGAGVVVKAGSSPAAQALLGKTVALFGGSMYAQYRKARAADALVLPAGVTPAEGASCFVNPLTVLGMIGTMRLEGHKALVHTAAASNLGQMLVKACLTDGVPLVNVVRSPAQEALLRGIGATHVVDTTKPTFMDDLTQALADTGATLAFDAVGGGKLAGQILTAMEAALGRSAASYNRYGSTTHKQVYMYGVLDTAPTELNRAFGMAWGLGGWLLPFFLEKVGPVEAQRLRERVAREIKTTFASGYSHVISLAEALQPETMAAYNKKATGEKYLIEPHRA
jgi:NADPH:quinone reductase-like Zn-dependent oxidoreductase